MPYSQKPNRSNPGCILFLIDHSFTMIDECIGGLGTPKSKLVEEVVNQFIERLCVQCTRDQGAPRHHYDLGIIGYTTDKSGKKIVESAFSGDLTGQDIVPLPDLWENPLPAGESVWYQGPPKSQCHATPMKAALERAAQLLSRWIGDHQSAFPPLVIHITDGESTDGNPIPAATDLMKLKTEDGNVLLVNCHLSSSTAAPVRFPKGESELSDPFAKELFRMSSVMPDQFREVAEQEQLSAPSGCRMMVFNANAAAIAALLQSGTTFVTGVSDAKMLPPSSL
jgi:hypothetical protein